MPLSRRLPRRKGIIAISLFALAAIPVASYSYLYFAQDNLIFKPYKISASELMRVRAEYPAAEEMTVKAPDGVALKGWFLKNPEADKSPLLIYFAGNADLSSDFLSDSKWIKGWSLLFMDYRGYGRSGGKPSERNLFNDAVLIHDEVSKRKDVDSSIIVVLGRSLGTGVAVYLAHERPLKAVILVSPYDSIRSVAQERYPYAPVSILLKHPFDVIRLAPEIRTPMLAFVAPEDKTIPARHSMRLIEKWGGKKAVKFIEGADHNSILDSSIYRDGAAEFLRGMNK